jgi:hypothetical protein
MSQETQDDGQQRQPRLYEPSPDATPAEGSHVAPPLLLDPSPPQYLEDATLAAIPTPTEEDDIVYAQIDDDQASSHLAEPSQDAAQAPPPPQCEYSILEPLAVDQLLMIMNMPLRIPQGSFCCRLHRALHCVNRAPLPPPRSSDRREEWRNVYPHLRQVRARDMDYLVSSMTGAMQLNLQIAQRSESSVWRIRYPYEFAHRVPICPFVDDPIYLPAVVNAVTHEYEIFGGIPIMETILFLVRRLYLFELCTLNDWNPFSNDLFFVEIRQI